MNWFTKLDKKMLEKCDSFKSDEGNKNKKKTENVNY